MKIARSERLAAKQSAELAPPAPGLISSWTRFWFTPLDPIGLHAVRVLAGLLFLLFLLPLAGNLDGFYGLDGWFDLRAYKESRKMENDVRRFQQDPRAFQESGEMPDGPAVPLSWSALYLVASNSKALTAFYWLSVAVVVLFTLGVLPRLTAVLTWVIIVSFTTSPAIDYDADGLLRILAFYLMIGYVLFGQYSGQPSLFQRLLGSVWSWRRPSFVNEPAGSLGANLAVRLLQVHFAIVMVTSGLHKLQFGDWWAGVALWYPLYPAYSTTMDMAREHAADAEAYISMLNVAGYSILAWQLAFPAFAWKPRWRPVLVGGGLIGLLGMEFIYQLPLFGPAILIGCLSYLTPADWHRIMGWLTRLPGLNRLTRQEELPAPPPEVKEETPKQDDVPNTMITVGQR